MTTEDLKSWNELFPDCKIRESDLSKPTELFLTRTLIAYLQKFGYEVTPNFPLDAEETPAKRLFQITLAHHIDKILKISHESYAFIYSDLIRPTPKKTNHILGILLNYLYYYNMCKTDVFTVTSEPLRYQQELQQCIVTSERENEKRSERAEKIEAKLALLATQLPATESKVEALKAQVSSQREQLQKQLDIVKRQEEQLKELQEQKRNLKQQIVPDSETRELQTKLHKLKQNIGEQKQAKSVAESTQKEIIERINALNELQQQIAENREIVSVQLLEKVQEHQLKLQQAKKLALDTSRKKENLLQMIEKQQHVLKSFEEKIQLKETQFVQDKCDSLQLIANKEKQCDTLEAELLLLQNKEHSMECLIEEQKDISNYLHESLAALMSNHFQNFSEDLFI